MPPACKDMSGPLLDVFPSPIWNSCVACAFIGALFLPSGIIALKELDENDVSVFQSLFVRGVLTLPLLVSLGYRLTGHVMAPFDHNMKWIVLRGVCASCALLFNILSVTLIPLSEAAILNDAYCRARGAVRRAPSARMRMRGGCRETAGERGLMINCSMSSILQTSL